MAPYRLLMWVSIASLAAVICMAAPLWAEEALRPSVPDVGQSHTYHTGNTTAALPEEETPHRWFLLFASVNVYPKLGSEKLLDKSFNRPMHVLAPTYDDAKTFGDLRDDCLLWPPHFGVGRVLSNHWAAFAEGGYSAGKVRTKADDPSILLLPLHTDVEIQRGALYAGLGLDFFPNGMVEHRTYKGFMERLRASKPYLGARVTWTYATYDAKVKAGFKPLGNLIDVKPSDGWLVPSVNTNLGIEVPFNKQNLLSANFGYNFFAARKFDFDGPSLSIAWKHFLGRKKERKVETSEPSENPK